MCEFCSNDYHLSNAKWGEGEYGTPGGTVTWSFATTPGTGFGFSSYINDPDYRALIRDAFQAWEDVIDIDFVEVTDSAQTDVRLGWDTIDGPFNVVGQASSRGSKTTETLFSMTEAEIRFDVSENWSRTHDAARDEVGLFQVALHEIGHVLGLDHTNNPDTILFASDISDLPGLTEGDIAGAQIFYGPAQSSTDTGGTDTGGNSGGGGGTRDTGGDTGGNGSGGSGAGAGDRTPTFEPTPDPYVATIGNDSFTAQAGNDVINGLAGIDTLNLTGDQSQYTLSLSAGGITLTDRAGRDGSDTLINIERLDFQSGASTANNGTFDLDTFDGVTSLEAADFTQIIELYIAYFNRAPDAVGLAFWGNAFAEGLSLEDMAALFIDQDETRDTYPDSMSNADFTTAVYNNVLGRIPDQAGFEFWVDVLDSGARGRDVFILSVLDGVQPPGPGSDALSQRDHQYLADKTDIGTYFAVTRGLSDLEDAADVLADFTGSQSSIQAAIEAVEAHYADALSPTSGDFLLPLVGILDDPFSA